jgi:drug/metabolite transporter (DMT)-like permease
MLINTIAWGAALPLVKPVFSVTTPFFFLLERFLLAGLLTLPVLIWYLYKQPQLRSHLPQIIGLEIIGTTIALALLYTGLSQTSALEASLLTSTTPLFTTLGGIWFLHEKQERHEWFGLMLAFIGTILLVAEPLMAESWSSAPFSFTGNFLIFLQNIAIATYYLLAKRWYKNTPKFFATSVSFWVGVMSFGLLSWLEVGSSWTALSAALLRDASSPAVWMGVIYMATFGSILGLTAYIKGQDGMEASEASLFTYLQPLVAIPLAWILLGEQVNIFIVISLLLIFAGVSVAEIRWKRRKQKH